MNNPNKIILRIAATISIILILFILVFIYVIKKNGITEFDKKMDQTEKIAIALKGIDSIPKSAFWIENNGKGNWFNVDWIHNHKNNAIISVFDKNGELLVKSKFILVCAKEGKLIENLKKEIFYFDGEDIQLKAKYCYLMKRK